MKLRLNLIQKLMLMLAAVLVVSITGVVMISTIKSNQYLTDSGKSDLAHMAVMAQVSCQVTAEEIQKKVKSDLMAADAEFELWTRGSVTVEGGQMIADPMGQRIVVNDNTDFVDMIKSKTGSLCTIFLNDNAQSRRIATNVLNDQGRRAVGTYVSQPVYDAVVNRGQTFVGRAWVVNDWYVTAYKPIHDEYNNIVGILFVGVKEQSPHLSEALLAQKVGKTGYIYTMNKDGVLQVHPNSTGKDISANAFAKEMMSVAPNLANGEVAFVTYEWERNGKMAEKITAYTYVPEWEWIIGVGSYLDEFTSPANNIRNAIIFLGIGLLAVSMVIGFFIGRSIVKPIVNICDVAEAVALGDITKEITYRGRDEVGVLADSFRGMMDYLKENAEAAERIAENDLTVKVNPRSANDTLGNAFHKMITNLTAMIRDLRDNTRSLVSAATEISSASEQMAAGAQNQSDQASQVSTAVEEMTVTIVESSKNANEAKDMAEHASETSQKGRGVVDETISGLERIAQSSRESGDIVNELAAASDRIGQIIGVIDDIADQTNLLALNAAIEAARAGEQGRGFAVVADEVRKLAERTGTATGEITEMIKGIQNDSGRAVSSMEEAGNLVENGKSLADQAGINLHEISDLSQRVKDMIIQIATASDEQSAAAEQISKNIEHISSVTKETATGAQQSAAAAEELNRQAERMQQMISKFVVTDE